MRCIYRDWFGCQIHKESQEPLVAGLKAQNATKTYPNSRISHNTSNEITPATAATTGTLEITNLSNVKYNFTYQQLSELPKTTIYAELYCYGNIVTLGDWSGVQLSYFLQQISDSSIVNSIQFVAADSYMVAIPISIAMAPENPHCL